MTRDLYAERTKVSELGRKMLDQGLTKGTGGNISVRRGDTIAINPSGVPYKEIDPEDVPLVDIQGEHLSGDLDPSSEWPMHTTVLRNREDIGSVIHTHSPYASTFASLGEPVPASHYLIAFVGDQIPVAPYRTPGTDDLARAALDALDKEYNACLLANHGVLAVGDDADAAYEIALMVEYCARIHYQAINVGEPDLLSDEQIDELIDIFRTYGQNA